MPIHLATDASHFAYFLLWFFLSISHIGQFTLLALLGCFIVPALASQLLPYRRIIIMIAVISAGLSLLLLSIDSYLFILYRIHLNSILLKMAFSIHVTQNFGFSQTEWWQFFILVTASAVIESLLALFSCHLVNRERLFPFWRVASITIGLLALSYASVILTISSNRNEISQQTVAFPLYDQFFMAVMPIKLRDNTLSRLGMTQFVQSKQARDKLIYPQKKLQCGNQKKKPNILFVVIDTWRKDVLNQAVMPNLFRLTNKAQLFTQHLSGGNATQAGLFSLFFSLPSTYWDSAREQNQHPVFFEQLKKSGYDFFIASSSKLKVPDIESVLFADVINSVHYGKGRTPGARDQSITRQFTQALVTQKKPFFGFLFYDSAHAYCRKQVFAKPFQPAIETCDRLQLSNHSDPGPYFNRYRNAIHFIDQEIQSLITALKDKGLLDNTLVVITGDHGQEFNDNQRNFWEHASNFSPIQVQTPLVILWPRMRSKRYAHLSSHYDVIPTLMKRILACNNPISDYSIGFGLFNETPRKFILVGSYVNLGIVEADRVTVLYPSGQFVVNDLKASPLPGAKPRVEILGSVLSILRRYYQK